MPQRRGEEKAGAGEGEDPPRPAGSSSCLVPIPSFPARGRPSRAPSEVLARCVHRIVRSATPTPGRVKVPRRLPRKAGIDFRTKEPYPPDARAAENPGDFRGLARYLRGEGTLGVDKPPRQFLWGPRFGSGRQFRAAAVLEGVPDHDLAGTESREEEHSQASRDGSLGVDKPPRQFLWGPRFGSGRQFRAAAVLEGVPDHDLAGTESG